MIEEESKANDPYEPNYPNEFTPGRPKSNSMGKMGKQMLTGFSNDRSNSDVPTR